jgi:succinate dehydrogenase/fumarate reductase cytochrome b subunit
VTHLSDDELVLHYYGESGPEIVAAGRHLSACAQCARSYEALARTLNSVRPPEFVEAVDDLPALRQLLRERSHERSWSRRMGESPIRATVAMIVLVWLASLVYPVSLQALFSSGRWAQSHGIGIPFVALTLMWACVGPFLAIVALNRLSFDRGERASSRALVVGAVMAAISPSLFLFVSRANDSLPVNLGMTLWYGVIMLGALLSLFRWPVASEWTADARAGRFLYVHRLAAVVLAAFVLAHVINQALAFISVSSYTAMRNVMRVASQQPASYLLLVGAVAIQIATGAGMGMKHVRGGAVARNVQAVAGWYLAAFMLAHVLLPLLSSPTSAAGSNDQFDLLASPRSAAQLPFLLLGVWAFLFHVGVYARLAALAYLAEASVRRLSYAGIVIGTSVVVTIALSLCGIHLVR